MRMKGGCGLHKKSEDWLYVKQAGAKLCLACLKAGLYSEAITAEAKATYPTYFSEVAQQVGDKDE